MRTTKVLRAVPLFLALCPTLEVAKADERDDRIKAFQNAQDKHGCLSIPYSDLSDQCQRKQAIIDRLCKQSGPWNCDDVDPRKMQSDAEALKAESDSLKRRKEELESRKSAASNDKEKEECDRLIKEIDDKIYQLRRSWESLQSNMDNASKIASDRLSVAKACRDAQPEVVDIFKEAKSRASSEGDKDIQPLAKRLIEFWEDEAPAHVTQMESVKKAVEACDKIVNDMGHLSNLN